MRSLLALLLLLATAAPAAARIVYCPYNGRPYDTSHGYYVDVPGTRQYVPYSRRPSRRPSRRRYSRYTRYSF